MSLLFRVLTLVGLMGAAISAYAAATIEAAVGVVRAGASAVQAAPVAKGQRVLSGSVVVTGPQSRATLRFEDGQAVALHENTEFRITDYAYSKDEPAKDKSSLELVKGSMRAVTGLLAQRSPRAVQVRTPQATAGIRGTDFMLAIVNPLYFRVLNGQLAITNSAGGPIFNAGAIGTVAADGSLALTVPMTSLPIDVLDAFNQLSGLTLAGNTGLVDQPGVPGTPPPSALSPFLLPGAAILLGIGAAIISNNDDNPTGTGMPVGPGTSASGTR